MKDDFAAFGLRGGRLLPSQRQWLLTVDFEAFTPDNAPLWLESMRRWAAHCRDGAWRFAFFTAVEDVVRLRVHRSDLYAEFIEAVVALHRAGVEFHPHNHCVFDPRTGERPTPPSEFVRRRVDGYSKGASMYYDVVYRNGKTFQQWLPTVMRTYDEFLRDARIERPRVLAFRSGGWDYGSTKEDVTDYLQGLRAEGFAFESGAVAGVYGTRSWKIGTPFGSNTFMLVSPLAEVAPTDFMNCGAGVRSIPFCGWVIRALRQPQLWAPPIRRGILVTVLHFDNLFHSGHGRSTRMFAVESPEEVTKRIDAFFARIDVLRRLLRLERCTFAELPEILRPVDGEALARSTPHG